MIYKIICLFKGHKLEKYKNRNKKAQPPQPITEQVQLITEPDEFWFMEYSDINGDIRAIHPCSRCNMLVIIEEGKKINTGDYMVKLLNEV